ncbi:chemotaxis protein chel [Pseudoroseomonas aestuarii]|uniref:Chemotaxis protein chel n=2 Tax=Teichococcus aestuarii TaxID=568898 RepID=A0A2U1V3B8_9PROT|nr:chemotaxis protein chel [Pseudoroseomonas aestuarii]
MGDRMTQPLPALSPLAAPAAPRGGTEAAQRRAAEAFEAQVLGALLQPMFETLATDGPFGGGNAEAQWRPMLVEQFGRAMAKAGGVGLGAAVLAEMQRLQAEAQAGPQVGSQLGPQAPAGGSGR